MSKNLIYCYSGSGNCLDIAKNIAKKLGDTDIVMMRTAPAVTDAREAERVGFVFPCYAGGLPGRVEEYVRNVAVGRETYKFAVCSYAGYPGVGLSVIDSIVGLDYWAGISHQCSCIWLFPHKLMLPLIGPDKAQSRAEKLAGKVAVDVLTGKKLPGRPSALLLNKVESATWPTLTKLKAQKLSVTGDCVGCGQCAKLCPRGNIRMEEGKPRFGTDCIQCLSCLQYCPRQAINMGGVTVNRERYHNPNVSAGELTEKVIHIE